MLGDVAAAKLEPALTDAVNVQVPAETKATRPVDVLIVQTEVVELAKLLTPSVVPAEGVEVIVGGVAVIKYDDVYEPAFTEIVREVSAAHRKKYVTAEAAELEAETGE